NSTNTALIEGAPAPSRKRINSLMSTRAKSLSPLATRAIASRDPLAILVVTARPSELNTPRTEASTKGAAPASIGGSKENWTAIGGRTSAAARLSIEPRHAKQNRPISEARMQLLAMGGLARIGATSGPAPVAMPGVLVSWHLERDTITLCRM